MKFFYRSSFFILMENGLPVAGLFEKAAYFLGWREIFIIKGDSMLPTLRQGDLVFINPSVKPKIGDIVLFRHPFKQSVKAVKRLARITADGRYFLVGDNILESSDSRSFGAISVKDVLGVAACRYGGKKREP
jgi:nickel-type superoxide dismutase maturation protease